MIIQNEYCDGGSLEDVIKRYREQGRTFSEAELFKILHHIVCCVVCVRATFAQPSCASHRTHHSPPSLPQALGLQSLHQQNLAHLDIKPGNIFLKTEYRTVFPERASPSPISHEVSALARALPPPSSTCSRTATYICITGPYLRDARDT
jgi:serine/threonine protein kinase